MFPKRFVLGSLSGAMAFLFVASSWAADLAEIKQRGEIRHIGIRYANFVTGAAMV
jgi:glutamine transport system substrate-binding protein